MTSAAPEGTLDGVLDEQIRRHAWAAAADATGDAVAPVLAARTALLRSGMGADHPAIERLDAVAGELARLRDACSELAGRRVATVTGTQARRLLGDSPTAVALADTIDLRT